MKTGGREVVITGMGVVSPFGVGTHALWTGVSHGQSGIDWIESLGALDPETYAVRYAGEVRGLEIDWQLKNLCEARLEKSVQMGLLAGQEALGQAGLLTNAALLRTEANPVSVIVGSGHGPSHESEAHYG